MDSFNYSAAGWMLALLTAAIVFAALTGDVLLAGAFIAFWLLVGAMRGGIGDD